MSQQNAAPAAVPTLVLKGPPSAVQGASALVRVEVRGAVPGQCVALRGWVNGRKVFEAHRLLEGADSFETAIPVPVFGEVQTLVLQASCQGARSQAHAVPLRLRTPGLP